MCHIGTFEIIPNSKIQMEDFEEVIEEEYMD